MNRNPSQWIPTNNQTINRSLDPWILRTYQELGFSYNLIMQVWNGCRGSQTLLMNTLSKLYRRINPKPRIKIIPGSTIIKKMPVMKRVHLKFEGDTALEYFELRKLGVFSKKAFRNAKSLHLEYNGTQVLENKHIEVLANHLNRGLRKLKHFSLKFDFSCRSPFGMLPLLKSLKQTFVNLASLQLSLTRVFNFSESSLYCFKRLFRYLGSTLKFLDLDFSGNQDHTRKYFSEALGAVILKYLPRLEGLCLDFSRVCFSTRILELLISGASTHLTRLSRLYINLEKCKLDQVQWSLYCKGRRFPRRSSSNLQDLKLNFDGCQGLSLGYLSLLQRDIVTFCPKLKNLFICTLNCTRFSNGFYGSLEDEFLQKLKNLEQFRLLYSYDLEKNLERYQEMQLLEMKQTMVMERKVARIKQQAGGEEEICLYLKTLVEEERAPEIDEPEYLQNDFENQLLVKEDIELEDQDLLESVIKNMDGMVEEAQMFLNSELPKSPNESEYHYCHECYGDPYIHEEINNGLRMEKEEDLQDLMEEEIRFRDLTKGGKVTQIYLNYGDDD